MEFLKFSPGKKIESIVYCVNKAMMISYFVMKNVLFLICAFALFTAGFASAAHAHAYKKGADQQVELSLDQQDNTDSNNTADPMCKLHCSCHPHFVSAGFDHAAFLNGKDAKFGLVAEAIVSSPVYGLKRPPRI